MKKSIAITIIMLLIIGILGGCVNAAASISSSNATVKEGENVKITVSFGEKVSAAQFTLNFDSSKFTYVSKSSGGSFSGATKKFAYTSEDGVTADLASVTFTFTAKTEGSSNFSISGLKISTATQNKITPTISSSSTSVKIEAEKVDTAPEQTPEPTPTPDQTPTTPSTPSQNTGGSSNSGSTSNNKPSGSTSSSSTSSSKPSSSSSSSSSNKGTSSSTSKQENKVIQNEIIANEIIANEIIANEIIANEIMANEIIANEIMANEISQNIIDVNETVETIAKAEETSENKPNAIAYALSAILIIAILGAGVSTFIISKREKETEKIINKYKE